MAQSRCATLLGLLLASAISFDLAGHAAAVPVVWTSPTITFTKTGVNTADVTDPANQDRMTANVWLTRASSAGIFNIAPNSNDKTLDQPAYQQFTSPDDTLWATSVMPANNGKIISAAHWQDQNLAFTTWAAAYGGPGPALGSNITTHNAVVHLLTDDIYLDLTFVGSFTSGGDFTYQRSTPPPPTGDYNHNNVVDAGDYVVWRHTLNQSASFRGSGADGDADGTINSGDFTYWRLRFGNLVGGPGAGLAPVPEPPSLPVGLELIAVVVCVVRFRR